MKFEEEGEDDERTREGGSSGRGGDWAVEAAGVQSESTCERERL